MVSVAFRRSLSFNQNPATTPSKVEENNGHVRSTSLPTRTHPLITKLGQEVRSLRLWRMENQSSGSTVVPDVTWLATGFTRLENLLHVTLDDLLRLQQTQDSLRRHRKSSWVDTLLDDFLHFADTYGCFREALVSLQQLQSAARSAVRRKDEAKLGSHARSQRKLEKEMQKLVSCLRDMGRIHEPLVFSDSSEAEMAGVMREVKNGIASASASVFAGLMSLSSECLSTSSNSTHASSSSAGSTAWSALKKKLTVSSSSKKTEEEWDKCLEGLKGLEKCAQELETGSDKVFRCLINTRVALLNILTP